MTMSVFRYLYILNNNIKGMENFESVVQKVIEQSDLILEILDARFIDETRSIRVEQQVKNKKKILIHVINKCDYLDQNSLEAIKEKLENCVFVSAKKHIGITSMRKEIKLLADNKNIKYPIVGVVGYPNVGKSSVINALKGRASARTSSEAGYTKGKQYLRIGNDFLMIDTPGVIPKDNKKEDELVLIGAKNHYTVENPDLSVIKLMKNHPGLVERKYSVEVNEDPEETIKEIALKLNLKQKGNAPDIDRASRRILQDWLKWNMG